MALLLAIESSCDDMAAAILDTATGTLLSHAFFSQIDMHKIYGGVVPEIASRAHIQHVRPIVISALEKAGVTLDAIDIFAATNRPGLAGSLLIGFSFAKGLAWALKKPFIAIDHLEGHIFSSFITAENTVSKPIPFPHIALSASGGHSGIYYVTGLGEYREIGNTRDDAAGEAFDKIAKLINLDYPGGPIIEKLSQKAGFVDFYKYPRTKHSPGEYLFSFSGLKTAVLYDLVKRGHVTLASQKPTETLTDEIRTQVASSLLVCIGDIFATMSDRLLRDFPEVQALTFVGGVACNQYLRDRLSNIAARHQKQFFTSEKKYSTDNGAMIAHVAGYTYTQALGQSKKEDRDLPHLPSFFSYDKDIFEE